MASRSASSFPFGDALATAGVVLRACGFRCAARADGGLTFTGPAGRGCVSAAPTGDLRLRYEPSALAAEPIALARLAAVTLPPIRITLRAGVAAAEASCMPAELAGVLGMLGDPAARAALPVEDLVVGLLAVAPPAVAAPVFFRLARAGNGPTCVDRAHACYLLVANARLRAARGGWIDGPGLAVDPSHPGREVLGAEISAIAEGLRALADPLVAESFLETCGPTVTSRSDHNAGAPQPKKEECT